MASITDECTCVICFCISLHKSCTGRLQLYQQLLRDGLGCFLLIKCNQIIYESPGTSPKVLVNNTSIQVSGKSELNTQTILAVHSTSASLQDFRLLCCILDPKISSNHMPQASLKHLVETTNSVVARTMKYSPENVILHS